MADREGPSDSIDWPALAADLDAVRSVSTRDAQLALAAIVGDERLRAAVDWYVLGGDGAELARLVLWHVRPRAARDRCVEIWRSSADLEVRRSAIELLRVVATGDDLPLVTDLLADADPTIQRWGFGVLDQLQLSGLIEDEDALPILEIAATHPDATVREAAHDLRSRLA